MQKKIIVLLLALVLALSLTACGGSKAPTVENDPPAQSTRTDSQDAEEPHSGETAENPHEGQVSGEAERPEQVEFRRGTVEGSTYTSDFLGLTLTLADGWIIADEEQLAQLDGLVTDSFTDEDIKKQLASGSTMYEFYALRQEDNASINITVQGLSKLGGIMVDEDAYADASLTQMPDMLASGGITVTSMEKATVDFAGSPHTALTLEGTVSDVPLHEIIVLKKVGSYMAVITVGSFDEANPPADLLALFQGL